MAKIVPLDIVNSDIEPPIQESNLIVDYDVKIEMVVLETDDNQRVQVLPEQDLLIKRVAPINAAEQLGLTSGSLRVEPYPEVVTHWFSSNHWFSTINVNLYEFRDSKLSKYLPSRVYYDDRLDKFVLLYYTSPMINMQAFAPDGVVYCCAFPLDPYSTYKYDVRARVFIDQIKVGSDMYCFMIFTTDSYDLIVSPKVKSTFTNKE